MCGIAGIFGTYANMNWLLVQKEHLRRRGPDSQELLEINSNCQMVACRLAMTDPHPRSNQPFIDVYSGNTIVFNGEIYNFRELKSELSRRFPSEHFFTKSDTEVLLRLLDKDGEKALEKIQGMFAFSYFQRELNELWLGRDVLGKKPLYWTILNNSLFWSSSIESFSNLKKREISENAFFQFMSLGYILDPESTVQNSSAVNAGEVMVFENQKEVHLKRTTNIQSNVDIEGIGLRKILSSAVSSRTESHHAVALSLSGGVDSSIIAIHLAENGIPTRCFSSIWRDSDKERYNKDALHAAKIAKALGLEHELVEMPLASEIPNLLVDFLDAMEEPNGNPSGLSLYKLYQEISKSGYKLVLTGDGSDEIFGGYQRYRDLNRLPNLIKTSKPYFLSKLVTYRGKIFRRFTAPFLSLIDHRAPEAWLYWHLVFSKNELEELFGEKRDSIFRNSLVIPIQNYTSREIITTHPVTSLMKRDHKIWLGMESNRKLDRVSMHFSIEARSPFQDERVISWTDRHLKLSDVTSGDKRKLWECYPELQNLGVRNDKAGFISPVGHWLRKNPSLINESINYLSKKSKFNSLYIDKLKNSPGAGDYRKIKQLWHLIVWSQWAQRKN